MMKWEKMLTDLKQMKKSQQLINEMTGINKNIGKECVQ